VALTAYQRFKFFWGALEAESGYSGSQNVDLGASAVQGAGVAVRRAQLVFSRAAPAGWSEDVATMHFDFVNYTSGNVDDSWTTADFVSLESAITTWWGAIKSKIYSNASLREIRWYRKGPGLEGIPGPGRQNNPAVRVTSVGSAATASGGLLPPQVAVSITFKTGRRRSWGRTYLPDIDVTNSTTDGRIVSATCDTFATATDAMFKTSFAADFQPVVYSPKLSMALAIEAVQVDNIYDVIRRRRWESTTYRKVINS
jgi:hypothetical protein